MPDSVSAKLLRPLLQSGQNLGFSSEVLLAGSGLSASDIDDPGMRCENIQFARAIESLAERANTAHMPLRLAEITQPNALGSVGFAMTTANTLQGAYQALINYLPLLIEGVSLELQHQADHTTLVLECESLPTSLREYLLACLLNLPRWLTGQQIIAKTLSLTSQAEQHPHRFPQLLVEQIDYQQPYNGLTLASHYLLLPCQQANPQMHRLHLEFADSLLGNTDQQAALLARTRQVIRQQLTSDQSGAVRREKVAEMLNISLRTLQRRLEALGTNFQEIYDQSRHDTCLQLIASDLWSFGEIAFKLGFSNQSAFQKAFKRWMGVPPSAYRANLARSHQQFEAQNKPASTQPLATELNAAQQAERLAKLSAFCRNILQAASLICHCQPASHGQFDLAQLATLCQQPIARLAIHLWPAQQQGLIAPLPGSAADLPSYAFLYADLAKLLQQQIDPEQRTQWLLSLGDQYLKRSVSRDLGFALYLQASRGKMPDKQRQRLSQVLERRAKYLATRARHSEALKTAQGAFRLAASQSFNALTKLYQYALNAAELPLLSELDKQLAGRASSEEQWQTRALQQAEHWLLKHNTDRAIDTLLAALERLSLSIPQQPQAQLLTLTQQLEQLPDKPYSGAASQHCTLLLDRLSSLALEAGSPLLASCAASYQAQLASHYHQLEQLALGYSQMAWIYIWFTADRVRSEACLAIAEQALAQVSSAVQERCLAIRHSHIDHWFTAPTQLELKTAVEGVKSVDEQHNLWLRALIFGPSLQQLEQQLQQSKPDPLNQQLSLAISRYRSTETSAQHYQNPWQAIVQLQSALLCQQQALWPELCYWDARLEGQLAGHFLVVEGIFLCALMHAKLARSKPGSRHLREAQSRLARFELWTSQCPEHFDGRLALLRAELGWQQPLAERLENYEKACQTLAPQGAQQVLCQLSYAECLADQLPVLSQHCQRRAEYLFNQWLGIDDAIEQPLSQ